MLKGSIKIIDPLGREGENEIFVIDGDGYNLLSINSGIPKDTLIESLREVIDLLTDI